MGAAIRVAGGVAIGTISGAAVKIAGEISGAASNGVKAVVKGRIEAVSTACYWVAVGIACWGIDIISN